MIDVGIVTIVTAGQPVRLSMIPRRPFLLCPVPANTGLIYWGGVDVLASARRGIAMGYWEENWFDLWEPSDMWVDATVSGESLSWAC